jgi:hypothetical protein
MQINGGNIVIIMSSLVAILLQKDLVPMTLLIKKLLILLVIEKMGILLVWFRFVDQLYFLLLTI